MCVFQTFEFDGFPIHIDTIGRGLHIVYLKGSHIEVSALWCIISVNAVFI